MDDPEVLSILTACLVVLLPLFAGIWFATRGAVLEQKQAGFRELAQDVVSLELVWRERLSGKAWRLEGEWEGRRVGLCERYGQLRYELRLRYDPGTLRLDRDALLERASGEQAREMSAGLDHLFGVLGFSSLEVEKGWLVVERPLTNYASGATSLAGVYDHLLRLAPLLETRELKLEVAGVRQGRGWTGGGEGILCPYCRDTIASEAPDPLTACPHCRTVHHAECFEEAAGCTLLGCAGRRTERVRE